MTILQSSHNTLQTEHEALETEYDRLTAEREISEALRIGHLLASYYDQLREASNGSSWWGDTSTPQDKVNFAANLAKHGLGKVYWISYEDNYYGHANEHSYTTARKELDGVLSVIGIQVTDSSVQKIDRILDFMNTYIRYESDYNEQFLAPMETLGFLSGDCDDYAILAAALFEAVGIDSAVGFFKNGGSGHAMTLVRLDDISPYGCWCYSDLTGYGLQAGTWLIIEPQATIENQMTDWVYQCKIQVAAEV